jgi:hypothetical protein
MALRIIFGGSLCPTLCGIISESITGICNSLLNNEYWDHTDLYGQLSDTLDKPLSMPESPPLIIAQPLAVSIPYNMRGIVDKYIYDYAVSVGSQ